MLRLSAKQSQKARRDLEAAKKTAEDRKAASSGEGSVLASSHMEGSQNKKISFSIRKIRCRNIVCSQKRPIMLGTNPMCLDPTCARAKTPQPSKRTSALLGPAGIVYARTMNPDNLETQLLQEPEPVADAVEGALEDETPATWHSNSGGTYFAG